MTRVTAPEDRRELSFEQLAPMLDPSAIAAGLGRLPPEQLRTTLASFLPEGKSRTERIATIEAALQSPLGQSLRATMARWIVDEIVPVERLVPVAYLKWRPPVRDAMSFVVTRLSAARLAPKLLEQLDLPSNTSAEERLLRLIAKVPGLQKLGQVIARNQHLRPALRKALTQLENGIRDVTPADIRAILEQDLGPRLTKFDVRISSTILAEASVSAVLRFSWRDSAKGRRQRGVFKVLKPHIPEYFAEDMDYLQGLAEYFGDQHHTYGIPPQLIADTFKKVRRLLQQEVNFAREQKTLAEAWSLYRTMRGVRIPQLIRPLCTARITALSEEHGIKVTNAAAHMPVADRRKLAERLVEALIAVPLLSTQENAIFHGDPHAGNLLYNRRADQLTIIDWALRERLSREHRRHLALLFLMVSLRDPVGTADAVFALSQHRVRSNSPQGRMIRTVVTSFLDELPVSRWAAGVDAMRLLEALAVKGIRFPGALIMLSKVVFTLDGILHDVAGAESGMGLTIARHVAQHWLRDRKAFTSPLKTGDWILLQCSALLLASRLWLRGEQAILDRVLPAGRAAGATAN